MRHKRILTSLPMLILAMIGVALLGFNQPSVFSDTNQAPYIYYYSPEVNSVVIERADGTDSRLLAPDVIPEADDNIEFEWSLSGQWVTLMSKHLGPTGYHYSDTTLSIVRSNGTNLIQLLSDDIDVCQALWAPNEDILFVSYVDRSISQKIYAFIDVETGELDIKFTTYLTFIDSVVYCRGPSQWIDDQTVVVTSYQWVITMPIDGQITSYQRRKVDSTEVSHYADGRFIFVQGTAIDANCLFIGRAWVRDLLTEREIEIKSLETEYYDPVRYIANWNPQRSIALLHEEICRNTYEFRGLSLLNWETGEQTHLSDTLDWQKHNRYEIDIWSPDGNYAVLIDTDESYHLLDVTNATTQALPADIEEWYWSQDNTLILVLSIDDGTSTRDVTSTNYVFEYELMTDTVEELFTIENIEDLLLSPNGQYITINAYEEAITLFDTHHNEYWTGLSHTAAFRSYSWMDSVEWHPDGEWFITLEISAWATYAGGGSAGPTANTVFHVDGSLRRELNLVDGEVGFVPERAIPYLGEGQPHSVVQQPAIAALHDNDIGGIIWTLDGLQLITLSANVDNLAYITVWNVHDTGIEVVSEFATGLSCWDYCGSLTWDEDGNLVVIIHEDLQIWDVSKATLIEERPMAEADKMIFQQVSRWYNHKTPYTELFQQASGELDSTISSDLLMRGDTYDVHVSAGLVATSYGFKQVNIWDVRYPEQLTQLNIVGYDVAFHPTQPRLAVASKQMVTIWDLTEQN